LCLFLLIGGGTAAAAFVVNSNSQVAGNTISGHHPPAGAHANIMSASVSAQDLATGSVTNAKLGAAAVNASKVQSNSLTGQQINESTLSGVNAATLGGKTSGQFIQGTGNVVSNTADIAISTTNAPVLNIPGIGDIAADCNGSATAGVISYTDNSPNSEDYIRDNVDSISSGALNPGNFVSRVTGTSDMQVYFVHSGGKMATIRVGFITPSASGNVPGGTCRVYAQAVVTG
jgi:hypothetical protein